MHGVPMASLLLSWREGHCRSCSIADKFELFRYRWRRNLLNELNGLFFIRISNGGSVLKDWPDVRFVGCFLKSLRADFVVSLEEPKGFYSLLRWCWFWLSAWHLSILSIFFRYSCDSPELMAMKLIPRLVKLLTLWDGWVLALAGLEKHSSLNQIPGSRKASKHAKSWDSLFVTLFKCCQTL